MAAKILMTGSIMMDLILQMPRIPQLAEKFLFVVHSVKIPTVKHFLACLLTQELMYPILH